MARLLVSVRNAAEALTAAAGGVDIIDLKEPKHGPLGCVDRDICRAILGSIRSEVAVRPPMSIAMGELRDYQATDFSAWPLEEFQFAKIGLSLAEFDSDWVARWRQWKDNLPPTCVPVAVSYVDPVPKSPTPERVLVLADHLGIRYALLDTFEKGSGRGLTDYRDEKQLRELLSLAGKLSITLVAAGGLSLADMASLTALGFEIVAVRGAACDENRDGTINALKVAALRDALRKIPCGGIRSFGWP
jgi:(5-formylfuran-3-yl)methyl phosphate synthase